MKKSKPRLDISNLPDGGYTLRVRGGMFNQIFFLCLSVFYFLFGVAGAIVFLCVAKELVAGLIFVAFACFFGTLAGFFFIAEDFTTTPWRIDDEGITVCYRRKKPMTLPWSEIKDWGFSYWGYVKYHGEAYRFYFSTQVMQARNDKTKKFPRKFRGVAIVAYVEDAEALRISGLIPYCRMHLDGDDDSYVPMFRSTFPLNRYGKQ